MTVKEKNSKKQNGYDMGFPANATLDEAMMITGCGTYNIIHMLLSGVILMGVIMQTLAMGYVMPAAQCDLDLTLAQRGWLAAIPFTAIIITSYFWGWLADTRGRRFTMLGSMLVSVILAVLSSFAPNLISFAVLQFLSAIFMAGPTVVVYTFLGEVHHLGCRDKMVAFGSSFVGIGTVVLPGIAWLVLPLDFATYIPYLDIYYRPWRLLVVACSIPFTLGSICLYFSPETPKYLAAAGRSEECVKVLRMVYAVNKWQPKDTFPVKTLTYEGPVPESNKKSGFMAVLESMKVQTVPLFKKPLLPWTLLICFVQFGIFGTTNGFYIWFPTILNSLANHNGAELGICDVLESAKQTAATNATVGPLLCNDTLNTETFERSIYIGLIFCSMYIIVGFLVDFIGKKNILIVILGITGLCGIGAHLAPNQQLGVILFAIFQMSGACIGLMNAVAVELFPTRYRGMAVCLSMMSGRLGSVVGSNLIGLLLNLNCGSGFYVFGGLIILCSLLCFTLPARQNIKPAKKVALDQTQNQTHEPV